MPLYVTVFGAFTIYRVVILGHAFSFSDTAIHLENLRIKKKERNKEKRKKERKKKKRKELKEKKKITEKKER